MAPPSTSIRELVSQVPGMEVLPWIGEVTEMVGLLIASRGPVVSIGDFVEVRTGFRPFHSLAGDRISQ